MTALRTIAAVLAAAALLLALFVVLGVAEGRVSLSRPVPTVHAQVERVNAPYDVWRVSGRVTGYVAEDDPRWPVPSRVDCRC